jgi:HEAT repeat protein
VDGEVPDDAYGNVAAALDALCAAAVNEESEKVRAAESWLLRQGSRPLTPLARIVLDEDRELSHRIVACRVLRKMGAPAEPAWKKTLQCQSQQVRINAIRGLAALTPSDGATLDALAAILEESDDVLRCEAATALAKIGPSAADACSDNLLAILNDPNEQKAVRDAAKQALKAVSPRRTLSD